MKWKMLASFAAAAAVFGASAAAVTELPEKGDWKNDEALTAKPNDVLEYTGKEIHATEKIKIDPEKITKVSCDFRTLEPDVKATLLIGFYVWDKNNRIITPRNIQVEADTNTELLTPCQKSDARVKVKDGANIKPGMVMAFNVADDKSDLPNFNVSSGTVKAVEKEADGFLVTFNSVINQEFPAGAKVRMHSSWGGYLYIVAAAPSGEFKTYSGTFQGKQWWPGTATVEPVILLTKKCKSEFKNFKIEVLDK
ncbi:MAG: hypothetical protein BWY31_03940 [Lentisphaerae bacterium ADurb.Bin242]|nr:MAG: hypothetical protein BWY31_03940 [Lentisphaerae bacterium ADurb.Bin242]